MTRRKWLLAANIGGLSASSLGRADGNLRARAGNNLKLGVFTSVYSQLRLEEAARRIKADGFSGVVLQFAFADVRFSPLAPDWGAAREITQTFDRHGIKIAGLSGYYNVVDPELSRRQRGEESIRFLIANWKRLGSPLVCTETGTLDRESQWLESPENQTEAAYLQCRSTLSDLAKRAEKTGAILAIEPYWRNVIDSAQRAERLFREVGSPSLKLVMDPANYYRQSDLVRMRPVLEDMFRRVGNQTVIAHAKDVKAARNGTELPAPGLGVLDYPLYLKLLARLDKEMCLVIEHLRLEDVPRARDYVLSQFERI